MSLVGLYTAKLARGSRAMLRSFCFPAVVENNMSSPSSKNHSGVLCGLPSANRVVRTPVYGPSRMARNSPLETELLLMVPKLIGRGCNPVIARSDAREVSTFLNAAEIAATGLRSRRARGHSTWITGAIGFTKLIS